MKFEIGYFLIYFLYLISYQMSRVVSRRIRDRLPFLMYTKELKLLTFTHLYCQLKSLYIIQRNYLLDNDSKLYLLYIGGLQAFMSLGKNEMKTHSHRQTSQLLLFLLRKEYHRGIVLPRKEKNCSNTRHRVCNQKFDIGTIRLGCCRILTLIFYCRSKLAA